MNRILVIEDDPVVREEILRILRFEDYEAIGASNGVEGLELAAERAPDCILCDLLMPELDGFETLARLRSRPRTATTPIIFLTARASREDIRLGMDMGADDYVIKPFTADELLSALSGRLARRQSLEEEREKQLAQLRDSITIALPHEFRTPLTVVVGFAELLERKAESMSPAQVSEVATDIRHAAKRLEHLVENFLLYADIELSASEAAAPGADGGVSDRGHAPAAIAGDAARDAAAQARREEDLRVEIEPVEVLIPADALGRVAGEIVRNAFKFSRPGTAVRVEGRVAHDSRELALRVTDHGRGMSAEEVASIGALMQFRRRLHEQQGSGLGLVIAKRLVERSGGRLDIESRPGISTIVTLRLPLA